MRAFFILKDFFRANAWRYGVGIVWLIAVNIAQLAMPYLLGHITDQIEMRQAAMQDLLRFVGYILAIAAVVALSRFLWRIFIMGTARKLEYHLRDKLFSHLQILSVNFFNKTKTGDLMAHATNDIRAVRMALGPGIIMFTDSLFLTVATVFMMSRTIDWQLTLLAMAPLPFLAMTVALMGRIIHRRFKAVQEAFSNLTERVQENLSGIRVIKSFVQEKAEIQRFNNVAYEHVKKNMHLVKLWGLFSPLIQFISGLSYLIALGYGGIQVINGRISLGDFVAFNSYLLMLVWPMMALGMVINVVQRGAASMDRLKSLLDNRPEIYDAPDAVDVKQLQGNLEICNLSFSYPDGTKALREINIHLPQGKTLAIIGRTGSGKTTLMNLLLRLYNVPPGKIYFDGNDINRVPLSVLRTNIGYVPQDNYLFSATIHENIAFDDEDKYTRPQVEHVAKLAEVYDNIVEFPQQFDTLSGERGVTLSGGQKQRVSIARALIKDPAILILDDCFSAVDTHTEEQILTKLRKFMEGRTSIIISHRVSTVKDADEIIVMDQGRILERGDHKSLLRRGGLYQQLHHKQQLEEKIAQG